MKKEINFNINLIKFIAISAITLFHINLFNGYEFKILNYGWLGCALFFIASGYLNANQNIENKKLLINRIIRLLPLYYVSLLFWLFVKNFNFETMDIIKHLAFSFNFEMSTFYSINSVAWFCAVLIQIYLLYFLIVKNFINKKYFTNSIIVICQLITLILSAKISTEPTITKSVLVYLPCFLTGILIKNKNFKELMQTLILSIILLLFAKIGQIKYTFLLEYLATTLIFATIALANLKLNNLLKNIINFIAQASYSIYLFNYVFIFLPKLEKNITIIYSFIFVFFIGFLINQFVDKNLVKISHIILDKNPLSNTIE